jgi:predicted DNA-binding ribbon-helix-helix protein
MGKKIVNIDDKYDKTLQQVAIDQGLTVSELVGDIVADWAMSRLVKRTETLRGLPHSVKVNLIHWLWDEKCDASDINYIERCLK